MKRREQRTSKIKSKGFIVVHKRREAVGCSKHAIVPQVDCL